MYFFLHYLVVVRATILFVPQPSYLCVCQDVGRRPGISEENVFILARANVAIVVQDSTRRVQKIVVGVGPWAGVAEIHRTTGFRIP